MSEDREVWKPVPNYPAYEVSSLGRLRRVKTGRIYLQTPSGMHGQLQVTFRKDGRYRHVKIHRLVAEVFLDDYDPQYQVEFKDGDNKNCRASNLSMGERRVRLPGL